MRASLPDWILRHAVDLQTVLFFGGLLVLGWLERVAPRRPGALARRRRWPANFGLTALNVAALGLVPVSFVSAALWAESAGVGLFHRVALPAWALGLGTLLVRAFLSFGTHVLNHRIPWLWRIHRVHHLDTELDVSSTVRFHPLEMIVGPLLGVPVVVGFGLRPSVASLKYQ